MLRRTISRARTLLSLISFLMPIAAFAAPETVKTVPVDPLSPETQDAIAKSGSSTNLDVLEVTGSRIKRADYETAQPVLSLNREAIERTGLTSIGDVLQKIAEAGSALNTNVNNGGNGETNVDLRNLGAQRVLVLVNGHRWITSLNPNNSSAVDLNTIPISIIERVEVLKDGASAVYGSDAVAGVVNIITRKNFQGTEIRSQIGGFIREADGFSNQTSLSFGSVSGATSLFTDLNYVNQEPTFAGDREISSLPKINTGLNFGSGRTPQGRFLFIPDPNSTNNPAANPGSDYATCKATPYPDNLCNLTLNRGTAGNDVNNYRNFTNNDRYNFAPINYLSTPNERASIFTAINHDFGDVLFGTPVSFSGEFLYNLRRSKQQLAETPIDIGDFSAPPFDTLYVAQDNQFNPFGQDIGRNNVGPDGIAGTADDFGSGLIGRRFVEGGPRIYSQTVDTFRLGGGFKGSFDLFNRFFSWESGAIFSESHQAQQTQGLVNLANLAKGIGPAANCAADSTCVPVNVFGGQGLDGRGTITGAMLNYLTYTAQSSAKSAQNVYYAYLSNDLFSLPAGVVNAAYGLEYRHDTFTDNPDTLEQQGISSNNRAQATAGSQTAREAYAELSIPLVSGIQYVETLDLSLAGRYSDYDRFGSNTTYKVGVRWKIYQDLLMRGTYSTAFRAPSVSELFLGLTDSADQLQDPCSSDVLATASQTVKDNCADPANPANGGAAVPANYTQANSQLTTRLGGNANLKPEKADTFTVGFVFSPEFIPDFNVYADYFNIDLKDAIDSRSPQEVLDNCYNNRTNCDQITRGSGGNIKAVSNLLQNIGGLQVEGVDLAADYTLPWFKDYGVFKVSLDSSYLLRYDQIFRNNDGSESITERAGTFYLAGSDGNSRPRLKGNLNLGWNQGPMRASWVVRYIGEQTEDCDLGSLTQKLCSQYNSANPSASKNDMDATFYNDVQFGYSFAAYNFDISGGVNNLFDQDPPISYSAFANSYDVSTYDIPGMVGYLRIKKGF